MAVLRVQFGYAVHQLVAGFGRSGDQGFIFLRRKYGVPLFLSQQINADVLCYYNEIASGFGTVGAGDFLIFFAACKNA